VLDLEAVSNLTIQKIQIKLDRVDPRELVMETLNLHKLQADMKKIELAVKIDQSLPKCIESDPTRLQQIVHNMLSNAVKFTREKGHVSVEIYYDHEHELLQVSVIDDGVPIPDSERHLLFKAYSTLPAA
jgi:two-component system, sensor histidine kinase RetS